MMRSMSSVFLEHQLLHCQTIEQCLMLNAYVRKGRGKPHAEKSGQWLRKRYLYVDVLYGRPPKEKCVNEGSWFHSTGPMKIKKRALAIARQARLAGKAVEVKKTLRS